MNLTPRNLCCALGVTVQIVVLGEALFVAIATLYSLESGTQVFRYAGF